MEECLLIRYAKGHLLSDKKRTVIKRMKKLNVGSDIIHIDVAISKVYMDYYGNAKTTDRIKKKFNPLVSYDKTDEKNPYAKAMEYKTNRTIPDGCFKRNGNILTFIIDAKIDDRKIINLKNEIMKLHNQFNN